MTDKDPLEQAEDILRDVDTQVAAEMVKAHAEMTLFTAVVRKELLLADMLAKAYAQEIEYQTGLLAAVGLIARNWSRILADAADLDPVKYLEVDEDCQWAYAHTLCADVLAAETVDDCNVAREQMRLCQEQHGQEFWAHTMAHVIGLCASLVRDVMDVRNGDFPDTP